MDAAEYQPGTPRPRRNLWTGSPPAVCCSGLALSCDQIATAGDIESIDAAPRLRSVS